MSTVHTVPAHQPEPIASTTSDPTSDPTSHQQPNDDGRLRDTWPIHRRQTVQLLFGWAVLTAVWIGLGKLITGPLADSASVRADGRIERWMVARRTPAWNDLTLVGSYLAETITKVLVTALLAFILLKVWKRWFEPLVLVVSLVVEAAAFITVTEIVGRNRPDVPQLDASPVGSSFPSGHTAAAAAYTAIAVLVFWHTRKLWLRVLVAAVTALVPVIVGVSRMYRGMHHLTDVTAGALLGLAAVALTVYVLAPTPEGRRAREEADR